MKKIVGKKFLSLLLVLILLTSINFNVGATDTSAGFMVPESATQFAEQHYKDILEVVKGYKDDFKVISTNSNDYSLGEPYVVYDLDVNQQDEIYYYPVIDSNGKVVLTLDVIGTTNGWGLSASEEMVDSLNNINYKEGNYIFYKSGDSIIAENNEKCTYIKGSENDKCNNFKAKDYKEKDKIISNIESRFLKTDTSKKIGKDMNRKSGYTPAYSESTSTAKVCSLYNSQGQGSYGICWAAADATIANYLNGTSIIATAVCDKVSVGYYAGGGIGTAQLALSYYGVSYNNLLYSQLSWSSINTNLNNKYPIYVEAYKSGQTSDHSVTVYGYRTVGASSYVVIWNSGLNSGAGATQVVYYYSTGTTFTYNNLTWTWIYSLSKYA